jgi:hypothetical protein
MAARAARVIAWGFDRQPKGRKRFHGRAVVPSDTSLDEASASAVLKVWFEWQCYSALCGDVWNSTTIQHLARYAWRTAFQSLTRDRAQGMTGRMVGRDEAHGGTVLSIQDTPGLIACDRESLGQWAQDRQGRIFDSGRDDAAILRRQRRAILQWFADVLDVRATGRTGASERARFSVLARLVYGQDIASAAHAAGFASGRAALESFRSGKVWDRLKLALHLRVSARERKLMAIRARAVRAAMRAIHAQREARTGAGFQVVACPIARPSVRVQAGTSNVRKVCGLRIVSLRRPHQGLLLPPRTRLFCLALDNAEFAG